MATGRTEELTEYLRQAWTILRNVGLHPHGLTLGGMDDKSGIAGDKMANRGYYSEELAKALLTVELEFDPTTTRSFIFGPFAPGAERGRSRNLPQVILETNRGARVYRVAALPNDPAFPLLHGDGDLTSSIDTLISPDLARGCWVDAAEQGLALVIVTHAQTLNAANTGMGLQMFRESVRRLRKRYGNRLVWHTADELCQVLPNSPTACHRCRVFSLQRQDKLAYLIRVSLTFALEDGIYSPRHDHPEGNRGPPRRLALFGFAGVGRNRRPNRR
jgi:hypothetical protein